MDRNRDLTLQVSADALRRVLVAVVLGLAAASFLAQLLKYPLDTPSGYGLVPLFDGDAESNVPTFYSSLALLACAALLYVRTMTARRAAERYAGHWMALAMIFLLGALDETAQLHELVNERIIDATGTGFDAPWVILAAVLGLALAPAYRDFARDLPGAVRNRALLGVSVFVAGAVGLEVLEAIFAAWESEAGDFADGLASTVQELCEMLGVVFVLEALVIDASLRPESFRLRFR